MFWYELCLDRAAGSLAPPLLALLVSLLNIGCAVSDIKSSSSDCREFLACFG